MQVERESYEAPALVEVGTFESLTQATNSGPLYDGNYSLDGHVVPDQHS